MKSLSDEQEPLPGLLSAWAECWGPQPEEQEKRGSKSGGLQVSCLCMGFRERKILNQPSSRMNVVHVFCLVTETRLEAGQEAFYVVGQLPTIVGCMCSC